MSNVEFVGSFALNGIVILKVSSIENTISTKANEILDKKINVIKTNRGGKITWHGPGQIIFYFVINLSKRKKDIRKFVNIVEKIIIDTLKEYNIKSFSDRKNVGIWVKNNKKIEKVAAIGIKVRKWIYSFLDTTKWQSS